MKVLKLLFWAGVLIACGIPLLTMIPGWIFLAGGFLVALYKLWNLFLDRTERYLEHELALLENRPNNSKAAVQ